MMALAPDRPTVHPHVRGDDAFESALAAEHGGSPPRAWGRRTGMTGRGGAPTVHPHVRGDDDDNVLLLAHDAGSPPRAWGRHLPG